MTIRSINQKRSFGGIYDAVKTMMLVLGLAAFGLFITVHLAIELWPTRVFQYFEVN